MKKLMIRGRFWKEDTKWVAHIPSLGIKMKSESSFMSLVQVKEEVEKQVSSPLFKCSISVYDQGIFLLDSNNDGLFREYIRSVRNVRDCLGSK